MRALPPQSAEAEREFKSSMRYKKQNRMTLDLVHAIETAQIDNMDRLKQLAIVMDEVYATNTANNINAVIRHMNARQQTIRHEILELARELKNLEAMILQTQVASTRRREKLERQIVFKKAHIQRILEGTIRRKAPMTLELMWKSIQVKRSKSGTKKAPRTKSVSRPRSASKGGGRSHSRSTRKNIPVRGFAVVQSSEKPWVKEPNYRRWLGKLKRHTAKVRRHGEVEHPDNLCVDSDICKGDLGIPRRLMPQFTTPRDIQSFMTFAERRYGVKSRRATRRAARLKPSQEEINRERVEDVKEDIVEKKLNPNVPLIVSRDGYVIDGHHRWAAYKSHHPTKKLPVLLVGASARDVLSIAATWGAKHHQF
jgi:ParB-like chromosome segregation protein Spo0J